jgi:methanogenic corrinoid protein MtbC1
VKTTSAATESGGLLRQQQTAIAEELVERQFAAHPELAERYGPSGRRKCLEDAGYHLSYLADAMDAGQPLLFASYVGWAKVMLGKRGIPLEDLASYLELTRTLLIERFDGTTGALAAEYLTAGLAGLPSLPTDLPCRLDEEAPYGGLARTYLEALLNGERHLASQMILGAVASGTGVKDIYQHVFQPAQHEVGRLWQINEISVAQEHYCTAATQLIMSQLYPKVFASEKGSGTLVATCVAGDLHEIGLRMVTDFFEMDGWNTFYLGANMPARPVVETVAQRRAHVLCISATISLHLRAVSELIHRLRAHPHCGTVKVLVGGHPFVVAPDLWRTMGADGSAASAHDATAFARRWAVNASP